MALTAIVTKHWPTLSSSGTLSVGIQVVLNDDDTANRHIDTLEQRRRSFVRNASKGDDVEQKADEIIELVQAWINHYIDEKNLHKHAKYGTLRDTVQAGLDLTE